MFATVFIINSEAKNIAYNIRNQIINFDSIQKPNLIIFYQNPSCSSCIKQLGRIIDSVTNKYFRIFVVIKTNQSALAKKETSIYLKKYINFSEAFYVIGDGFTTKSDTTFGKTIFDNFNVVNTPSILFNDFNSDVFIEYREMFGYDFNDNELITLIKKKMKSKRQNK